MTFPERGLFLAEGDGGAGGGGGGGAAAGGEGGAGDPGPAQGDWFSGLPEDIQKNDTIARFKGKPLDELTKAHINAQTLIRDPDRIKVPGEKSAPEEVKAFYKRLGVPEDPKGYTLTKPVVPDGVKYDEGMQERIAQVAHRLNLSPAQAQGVLNLYGDVLAQANGDRVAAFEKMQADLKAEWRTDAAVERNMAIAARAVRAFDPTGGLEKALLETGAVNRPEVAKFFFERGKTLMEDGILTGTSAGVADASTLLDAIKSITENKESPDYKAYFNKSHPRHMEVVERVLAMRRELELYEKT